ncbi:RadC family protein [Sphingomonas profundi]|uniref:RadC family protein n=1 Tax=Alterirhizorhabdus profundi TaxID=2681549 RepID=UPI0012E865E4|nr:DNA repair protein RadC [Sphingomonas profundi]
MDELFPAPAGKRPKAPADPGHDASGHRGRLRRRLIEQGPDALQDHELVEYLLGLAIPRRDTKPLARRLIAAFGSYGALVHADPEALARIGGLSEGVIGVIKIAEASALRMRRSQLMNQPVLASWDALIDYLHIDMADRGVERVRALHLNSRNQLIRDDLVSEGSIDQAAVYVREVMRKAIDFGTSSLILVHNHPSGDPRPSKADIALTRDIVAAGRLMGVTVHDHVVIGRDGHASMRALGLLM